MRDPRWIGTTFHAFIHLIRAAHFTRYVAGYCVTLALLSSVVLWQPEFTGAFPFATLSEVRLSGPYEAEPAAPVLAPDQAETRAGKASPDAARKPEPPVKVASVTGPRMDLERHNLASFIATRYKIAYDNTELFVDGAYKAARDNKLDPWLLLAVMAVESSFDPGAASSAGAHGLMQVLTKVHADKFAPFGGVAAAFDPIANIKVGARILRDYIVRDGSVESGLKAYVGSALMGTDGGYGNKVMAERERLAAVATGKKLPVPVVKPAPAAATATADSATGPAASTIPSAGTDAGMSAASAAIAATIPAAKAISIGNSVAATAGAGTGAETALTAGDGGTPRGPAD